MKVGDTAKMAAANRVPILPSCLRSRRVQQTNAMPKIADEVRAIKFPGPKSV
ncbi:MAG: hypothetical protein P8123_03400 [bacterium]